MRGCSRRTQVGERIEATQPRNSIIVAGKIERYAGNTRQQVSSRGQPVRNVEQHRLGVVGAKGRCKGATDESGAANNCYAHPGPLNTRSGAASYRETRLGRRHAPSSFQPAVVN